MGNLNKGVRKDGALKTSVREVVRALDV